MTTDIDVRTGSAADARDRLFDALDEAAVGDSLAVAAEEGAGVLLHQYQMKRDRRLDWEGEDRGDERRLRVTKGDPLGDGELTEFDVREMAPQRRHEVLLDTFDRLDPGEGFVLVNDHDPKPLYHELRSTRGETFEWEYADRDPGEWRVEIEKTGDTAATDDDVAAAFDVREIPKRERHPTIHHRYGNVAVGETIEIVAPHEPRPLRREFRQRYGDSFAWEVVESAPRRCRVRITKEADAADQQPADGDTTQRRPGSGSGPDARETDARGHGGHGHDAHGHEGCGHGGGQDDGPAAADDVESLTVTTELDVRDRPPAERHELIFDAYDDLEPGAGFVLVNDHDPKPLYHQFDAEAGPAFRWAYRSRDPGEFRVLVGKAAGATEADPGSGPSDTSPENTDAPF
ncbi:MAG: DUF2249 domain-containing protein [Halosimplex sp.]